MEELDDIDLLDEEERRSGKWQPFEYEKLGTGTEGRYRPDGTWNPGALMIDGKFVSKAHLKLDENYRLWMSTWWYDKKFTAED